MSGTQAILLRPSTPGALDPDPGQQPRRRQGRIPNTASAVPRTPNTPGCAGWASERRTLDAPIRSVLTGASIAPSLHLHTEWPRTASSCLTVA